jgi:hypothetical protein
MSVNVDLNVAWVKKVLEATEEILEAHDFTSAYKMDTLIDDVMTKVEADASDYKHVDACVRLFVAPGKNDTYHSRRGVAGGVCKQGVSKPVASKKTTKVSAEVKAKVIAEVEARVKRMLIPRWTTISIF